MGKVKVTFRTYGKAPQKFTTTQRHSTRIPEDLNFQPRCENLEFQNSLPV